MSLAKPQSLLWASPRASRGKIAVSGTSNRPNCGVIFVVCVM